MGGKGRGEGCMIGRVRSRREGDMEVRGRTDQGRDGKDKVHTHLVVSVVLFIVIKAGCVLNDRLTTRTKPVRKELSCL